MLHSNLSVLQMIDAITKILRYNKGVSCVCMILLMHVFNGTSKVQFLIFTNLINDQNYRKPIGIHSLMFPLSASAKVNVKSIGRKKFKKNKGLL